MANESWRVAVGALSVSAVPAIVAGSALATVTPTNTTEVVGVTSNDSSIGVAAVVVAAVLVGLAVYRRR